MVYKNMGDKEIDPEEISVANAGVETRIQFPQSVQKATALNSYNGTSLPELEKSQHEHWEHARQRRVNTKLLVLIPPVEVHRWRIKLSSVYLSDRGLEKSKLGKHRDRLSQLLPGSTVVVELAEGCAALHGNDTATAVLDLSCLPLGQSIYIFSRGSIGADASVQCLPSFLGLGNLADKVLPLSEEYATPTSMAATIIPTRYSFASSQSEIRSGMLSHEAYHRSFKWDGSRISVIHFWQGEPAEGDTVLRLGKSYYYEQRDRIKLWAVGHSGTYVLLLRWRRLPWIAALQYDFDSTHTTCRKLDIGDAFERLGSVSQMALDDSLGTIFLLDEEGRKNREIRTFSTEAGYLRTELQRLYQCRAMISFSNIRGHVGTGEHDGIQTSKDSRNIPTRQQDVWRDEGERDLGTSNPQHSSAGLPVNEGKETRFNETKFVAYPEATRMFTACHPWIKNTHRFVTHAPNALNGQRCFEQISAGSIPGFEISPSSRRKKDAMRILS
ncbi:hypothetical protein B0H16DRAFT_1696617 [Mycena metata]|uniref:Uncharacterized protein n=1 Tax=Mycena metata TaxID=1033252 RepID=A0AAD7MSX4_9AGAR|nr:hypothetical protein B0H16DRAFT_1696617 [Mycena metata]